MVLKKFPLQMKIARYLVFFLLCSCVVLFAVYWVFAAGYRKYNSHEIESMNAKLNGTEKHDILFIGSSRTYYHINPRIIDSVTHLNSFNGGIDGAALPEMNMIFQSYLKSHGQPKVLVIELAWPAFSDKWRPIFNPILYYPFLDNEIVFQTLSKYDRVSLYKYLPFLQLTQLDDPVRDGVISGLMGKKRFSDTDFYKGHLQSGQDTIAFPFKPRYGKDFSLSQTGVGYLRQIIESCRQQNIRVMLLYPPVWELKDDDLDPEFFPTLEKISAEYKIPFLNYRHWRLGNDHRLFRDEMHLNKKGADIFSADLARELLLHLKPEGR